MKVFITGGSGFIGSHLTDRLLNRGDQVLVVDNFETGRRDNLTASDNLQIIEDTITNVDKMSNLLENFAPDVVVHAAASYKNPENWINDAATNALGTAVVAQSMRDLNLKRLVYFQTALCYGVKPLEQPITLNHLILPGNSSYSISKTAGEMYIELSGLDYVSFRLGNGYGPRNISGPLPTFYHRLTNNKVCFVMNTRRDFIFVDDLVDCVMQAIDGEGKGTYHISSGTDYSIKELFDEVIDALQIKLDKPVEVKEPSVDDALSILLDPSRTMNDLKWSIKTPLKDGVKKTIEYYKEFGIQETYTHLKPAKV